ncbi:EAL and GGDEF domain-containing protein [Noviherbaspirillum sp. ST9]|uniref:sensor domain-containing protein n=1 Tax=Noviherbaspirillum sp. ST9 TaxID=3401606 RepID=UPI003B5869CA
MDIRHRRKRKPQQSAFEDGQHERSPPCEPADARELDYHALFDASPNPYLVLDRALNIVGANKAYLASTKRALSDIVGRWAWDAFPTDPDTLRQAIASFERAIRTKQPDTLALLRFDIPRPEPEGGGFEVRYWSIVATPVLNAVGEVDTLLQHPIDVTELQRLREALHTPEDGLPVELGDAQSGIFLRAQSVHEANLLLKADSERLRDLFKHAPSPLVAFRGKDLVFDMANDAYFKFVGRRDIIGKTLLEAVPELAGQGYDDLLSEVFNTGKPFIGRGMRADLRLTSGAPLHDVYFDALFQPVVDDDGKVTGIVCQLNDVTEAYRAQAALRESQDRLREGMNAARMLVWDWDLATGRVKLSENAPEIIGSAAAFGQSAFDAVHPDDAHAVRDAPLHCTPANPRYRLEYRLVRPDNGRIVWLENRGHVMFDHADAPVFVKGVAIDITERKRSEKQIADAARHDSLTGLPNRALLHEYCTHILARALRSGTGGALLFIDLDRFKPINDMYGHDAGDKVLQDVAQRLLACTRKEDVVSRLGGDEFIVVLPSIVSPHDPATVAGHIVAAVSRPIPFGELQLNVSPSIGISLFPEHGTDLESLVRCADLAMYAAKKAGRSNFKIYSPGINERENDLLRLEMQLKRAFESDGFSLHYQPIIEIRSQRVIGAEALLRMRADDGSLLAPADFIPVAEKAGMINRLGDWVVREACRQHRAWVEAGLQPITISINVSPIQFRQPSFASAIVQAVEDSGMNPSFLQIEVTESTLMDNVPETVARLRQLQDIGIRISLDDFGTGYSSLSYLGSLPLDKLKIDRSFIHSMTSDRRSRSITEAIIALGRTLNLKVVGEGIESEESMNFLRDFGCDQAQGFLFSHPLPAPEFASWYRLH